MANSQDTKVYRVHSFDHWDNLDEVPRYLSYNGANYLIYNYTSHCIKGLTTTSTEFVSEQCLEVNGDDPQLSQWNTDKETKNIEQYSNVSQVFKTIDANYIYCFPGEITIQN